MNFSIGTADLATHLKIAVVALFWAALATGFLISIH
jgi:hypothetical protein